jgi:hypothetical protein
VTGNTSLQQKSENCKLLAWHTDEGTYEMIAISDGCVAVEADRYLHEPSFETGGHYIWMK